MLDLPPPGKPKRPDARPTILKPPDDPFFLPAAHELKNARFEGFAEDAIVAPREFGAFTADHVMRAARHYAERLKESLRIFEPLKEQEEFLRSKSYVRLYLGGNRSGKTISGSAYCADVVTNTRRWASTPDRGTFVIVAKDEDTISSTLYPKLCEPGQYKIIKDPDTGLYRAVRPWLEYDSANEHLWEPAPPMLPPRFIKPKGIHWGKAGLKVPKVIELTTGWKILFYMGGSEPKAGLIADVVWLDEEVEKIGWAREMRQRLIDRNGCFYWTATPENCTEQLYSLYSTYLEGDKNYSVWIVSSEDHPHHNKEAQEKAYADMSEEEYDVKVRGNFRLGGQIVFPEIKWESVLCDRFPIPPDWCRYVAIDPGKSPCSLLFIAVPPPPVKNSEGEPYAPSPHDGRVYVYRELAIKPSDARKVAAALKEITQHEVIERFIIDYHYARQGHGGAEESIEDMFKAAFREVGVASASMGANFDYGNEIPAVRVAAVKSWLYGDNPKARIFRDLEGTVKQIKRYHHPRRGDGVVDTKKYVKKDDHFVDCLGYLAERDFSYVPPRKPREELSPLHKRLFEKNRKRQEGNGSIILGPNGRM